MTGDKSSTYKKCVLIPQENTEVKHSEEHGPEHMERLKVYLNHNPRENLGEEETEGKT